MSPRYRIVATRTLLRCCACAFVLVFLGSGRASGQEDPARWTFFPRAPLFLPVTGNFEEPQMGVHKEVGEANLIVGIGNMLEVVRFRSRDLRLSAGADFFVYGFSKGINGPALPIDAADGYFGGHIAARWDTAFSARLRILHLSAHFVDGHYDEAQGEWRGDRPPELVFRNFVELAGAFDMAALPGRLTAGFSIDVNRKPGVIRPLRGMAGMEVWSGGSPTWYGAYFLRVSGAPEYQGSNSLEGGVKFGSWEGGGIRLFLYYYNGVEIMGQYYDLRREQWGFGFSFDYW